MAGGDLGLGLLDLLGAASRFELCQVGFLLRDIGGLQGEIVEERLLVERGDTLSRFDGVSLVDLHLRHAPAYPEAERDLADIDIAVEYSRLALALEIAAVDEPSADPDDGYDKHRKQNSPVHDNNPCAD